MAVRDVLPSVLVIAVVMLGLSLFVARLETKRLIKPINELDLSDPLSNQIYEELTPLLHSIEKQNRDKEAVSQMRKEFSANVSHELKTPLTSISGYAEIMKNKLVKQDDIPEFAERIYDEASRLITLIENIIKLSKLDEGNVELEKENVDLFELSKQVALRLRPQAEKKRVTLEVTGQQVFCRGIAPIVDEMIYNICENAIKYNKDGGHVSIWTGNTLQGVKTIVADTGVGIPNEHQDRIFERFYRVDKSHSNVSEGTGLGLSIVKHGALLHKAVISVESQEGQGTKIEILWKKI